MPGEVHDTISTTQLARNLSAAIDRVRIHRRTLAITKGKRVVAELNPPPQAGYPVAKLAQLLESLPKLGKDAAGMAGDLARIRRQAPMPGNPWDS
ncbi:MAG: hypothetical protein ACRES7_02160 [Gammaproteobacteria bacterium]